MTINITMWGKALKVIPRITHEEWDGLDVVSRWLIASRAAVFIMTVLSGAIGGLMAWRNGYFSLPIFMLALFGIVFAHATNNMLNDLVDHDRGVDKSNYFRSQYGPQPLEHGLLSRPVFMRYLVITGTIASAIGIYLALATGPATWILFGAGLIFLLFYTWPLKYIGLGEPSVILVWGPLMAGGTYFVVSGGHWSPTVALLSLVYSLGPASVLFGKHTDKLEEDKKKGIYTLPVILGEPAARFITILLWILQYALVIAMVITGYVGFPVLLVLLALPRLIPAVKMYMKSRPLVAPEGLTGAGWPLYLVHEAFLYNRRFGLLFLFGLAIEAILFRTGLIPGM